MAAQPAAVSIDKPYRNAAFGRVDIEQPCGDVGWRIGDWRWKNRIHFISFLNWLSGSVTFVVTLLKTFYSTYLFSTMWITFMHYARCFILVYS
jgi:hypothetical protein